MLLPSERRDVRLESEMRAKAEVRQHAWVYKFTPRSDCR